MPHRRRLRICYTTTATAWILFACLLTRATLVNEDVTRADMAWIVAGAVTTLALTMTSIVRSMLSPTLNAFTAGVEVGRAMERDNVRS